MQLLVTGADGFIAQNLILALRPRRDITILPITRTSSDADLESAIAAADFVVHLAAVTHPVAKPGTSYADNVGIARRLAAALAASGRRLPILFTSTAQVARGNPYGNAKAEAEQLLAAATDHFYLYRLPTVFGKFAKADYSVVVNTFCHRIARGQPVEISNPDAEISLVYIDDVVASFLAVLNGMASPGLIEVAPQYIITVGALASQIQAFKDSRTSLISERVGTGLTRALYATYVSTLPTEHFGYVVPMHGDARGTFVEMLKTPDCGQFSFFTAHPGVTRGGHYHHTKTEKFLVIAGEAKFAFRHMVTGECYDVITSGAASHIVETIPGWTHNITNIGDNELVVMLWANEIFEPKHPDTYAEPV